MLKILIALTISITVISIDSDPEKNDQLITINCMEGENSELVFTQSETNVFMNTVSLALQQDDNESLCFPEVDDYDIFIYCMSEGCPNAGGSFCGSSCVTVDGCTACFPCRWQ